MEERKKEILKKIATAFPMLQGDQKAYVAGYISGVEDAKLRNKKAQTA